MRIFKMKKRYIVRISEIVDGYEKEISPGCIFSKPRDYSLRFIFDKCCDRIFKELESKIEKEKLVEETLNWKI